MNTACNGNAVDQSATSILEPVDHMNRVIGFVHALRYGFEDAAREYGQHFDRYVDLCDSVVSELEIAVHQLRNS